MSRNSPIDTSLSVSQAAAASQQVLQTYQIVKEISKNVLVQGVDYKTVSDMKKPVLLKSGAEKLLQSYTLSYKVENIEQVINWQQSFFYFQYKVRVIKTLENGVEMVLAEWEGSANSKERPYQNQNLFRLVDAIQNIALTRAFIGAVLQATGASSVFMQESECMEHHWHNFGSSLPVQRKRDEQVSYTPHHAPPQPVDELLSRNQQKAIFALAKRKQVEEDQLKALMRYLHKKERLSTLTKHEASELIQLLQEASPDTLASIVQHAAMFRAKFASSIPNASSAASASAFDNEKKTDRPHANEDPLGYVDRMPRVKKRRK